MGSSPKLSPSNASPTSDGMERWVALLRGVNVGGHRKLPMAELRAMLTELGLSGVATYIRSGNAVFRAPGTAEGLAERIHAAIAERFGLEADVLVLPARTLADAVDANPFLDADPAKVHLYFPFGEIGGYDEAALRALATRGESFATAGTILYLHAPGGVGRSDLAAKLSRLIDGRLTARNLRTCRTVLELARAT